MHETHPKVQFWTRKDYEDWLDSPEAGGSNHGLYAYLEDKNSNILTSEMLTKIQRALHAGWIELPQHKIALDTWGRASMTALQFIQVHMEKDFPLFKLMESGWKLKHLCTKTYSACRTKHLDNNGNLKRTTHNTIKGEALDDDDDLEGLNPSSKKCKGPVDTSLTLSNKKQKSLQSWDPSESLKLAAPDSSSTLTSLSSGACVELPIQEPPEYPVETASAQSTPQDVGADLANKENNPSIDNANILTTAESLIEFTCNGCREGPSDSVFTDASHDCKTGASDSTTKVKKTLQPLGTKNRWNLCMLQWLKKINANGQKEDFCLYWDKTLMLATHENYNNEAKELVVNNTWTKSIIKQGILHT
ncbi:hypothetical protein F5J12DRAFT_894808 [Pisolithus orientalis]|uniref:uncharacterized protein n=1 Tax=Pisolithus orientalis TaxID=936130 RepID=UPI0022243D4C|nr:uncharacterized protein F5J12DRAFT_894808 [Pisolithus orientalis]KAI6000358.1 hypothetical protein F5J12DRAFT_894808 [Pisolithus orientalis]